MQGSNTCNAVTCDTFESPVTHMLYNICNAAMYYVADILGDITIAEHRQCSHV